MQTGWYMSDLNKNYCALVVDNLVSEIIVANYEWVQQNLVGDWFDLGGDELTIAIGWIYENGQFVAPPEPEPQPILSNE